MALALTGPIYFTKTKKVNKPTIITLLSVIGQTM